MSEEIEKTQETSGTPDVFISYSTKNKNIADTVVAEMESHGIKCWYAPRDILPGEQWVTAIKNALVKAGVFVFIFTEESNQSEQVKNEVALAFNEGKVIVPFKVSDSTMNNELEYYLTRVHWLDASNDNLEQSVKNLRELVEKIIKDGNNITFSDNIELAAPKKDEEKKKKKKSHLGIILSLTAVALIFVFVVVALFTGGLSFILLNLFGAGSSKAMQKGLEYYYSDYFGTEDNEKAKAYFQKAADKKNADAYYYLGMLSEREFNYEEAKNYYEAGTEKGSGLSMVGLGLLYKDGKGVIADIDKANMYASEAVKNGYVEGYYLEGMLLQEGLSDKRDTADAQTALSCYNKALESEDVWIRVKTYIGMGDAYADGFAGVDRDYDAALGCYENAIQLGKFAEGLGNLYIGALYSLQEETVKADDCNRIVFEYYERAANLGNIEAMNRVGYYYSYGIGCEPDGEKALDYYKKAAENGNYVSLYNVGTVYETGKEPLQQNLDKAYEYYKRSSDAGYSRAMVAIAHLYYNQDYGRKDGKPDYDMVRQWYVKAAESGFYDAYGYLGDMYLEEDGVGQDFEKAKNYYLEGCDKGSSYSMSGLANYYYAGYEGKADLEEAKKWYYKAAYMGSSYAKRGIGIICEDEQNYEEAKRWYLMSIKDEDARAMYYLGCLYYSNLISVENEDNNEDGQTTSNLDEAYRWFTASAEGGDEIGMYMASYMILEGNVPGDVDYEKVYNYLYNAILKGDNFSYGLMGRLYENGYYVEKNTETAKECYKLALEAGDTESTFALGNLYYEEKDYSNAITCYEQIWKDYYLASYRLGVIYFDDIKGVVAQDLGRSKTYLEKAVELAKLGEDKKEGEDIQQNEDLFVKLGLIYYNDNQNEEAARCFTLAFGVNGNAECARKAAVAYYYVDDYNNMAYWYAVYRENGGNEDLDIKKELQKSVAAGLVTDEMSLNYVSKWLE